MVGVELLADKESYSIYWIVRWEYFRYLSENVKDHGVTF